MGRIKTRLIKRTALTLYNSNKEIFKPNFEENKKIVPTLADIKSKKLKNIIAGYLTRLVRQNKQKTFIE